MPNWKTHIELGKRLNKYINYNDENLNIFLLANILPDINNGYIVKDISKILEHSITHFNNKENPSYVNFYNKYKEEIKIDNPIFLGYYIHLFTDYTWNNDFHTKVKETQFSNKERNELRKIKQHDFKIFNNKYIENYFETKNIKEIVNKVKKIEEISINEKDIINVEQFIKEPKIYEGELIFYKMSDCERMMNNTEVLLKEFIERIK